MEKSYIFSVIMAGLFLLPVITTFTVHGQDNEITRDINDAPTVMGVSFGTTGLVMDNWSDYLHELSNDLPEAEKINCNKNGFLFDFFIKIKAHKQFSVGLNLESLTNRMSIQYYDATGLGFFQILLAMGNKTARLKINSILLVPNFSWYIPDNLPNFHPFIQASVGVGTTRIRLDVDDEVLTNGQGQDFVFVGASGFEAGIRRFIFHAEGGYRFYDPGMKYTMKNKNLQPGDQDANQSGFFVSLGIGIRLD